MATVTTIESSMDDAALYRLVTWLSPRDFPSVHMLILMGWNLPLNLGTSQMKKRSGNGLKVSLFMARDEAMQFYFVLLGTRRIVMMKGS